MPFFVRSASMFLACLVFLVFLPSSAGNADNFKLPESGIGIRILEKPIQDKGNRRADNYFVDTLHQGDEVKKRIEVKNYNYDDVVVDLYTTEAKIENSSFVGAERGNQNDLARWIALPVDKIEIEARKAATVEFTIKIPQDAEDGERYAAVWAQPRISTAPDEQGIALTSRVGLRSYVLVGDPVPEGSFDVIQKRFERSPSNTPILVVRVRNTGQRALDISATASLSEGPGGAKAGPFVSDSGLTLPIAGEDDITVYLADGLPNGPWKAHLLLESGTIQNSYEFEGSFDSELKSTSHFPLLLTAAIALFLVMLGLVIFLILKKRAKRDKDQESFG